MFRADRRGDLEVEIRGHIEATVQDTSELRWWLLGFGSGAEVLEPKALRDEFRSIAKDMANLYK